MGAAQFFANLWRGERKALPDRFLATLMFSPLAKSCGKPTCNLPSCETGVWYDMAENGRNLSLSR